MKIKTLGFCLSVVFLSLNVASGQSFNDILRDVSVIGGNDCNVDSSVCMPCTPKTCGRTCRGRIGFPTMHVLSSTSNHFSYCVQSKSLSPFPSNADSSITRQFTFKTSRTCSQKIEVKSATTISFWFKGSCTPACDFMTVSNSGTEEYKWSLDNTDLKVNDVSTTNTAGWTHIAFRVTGNTYGLFVNGILETVILPNIQVGYTVEFGPTKGFKSGGSVSFLDVRVYEDFLTDNEIKSIQNGSTLESCRCSTSHPKQTSTDTCESGSNSSQTRYIGDNATFYDIKAVFDSDDTTVWASKGTTVTLKLNLYDHYKVTNVNVEHEGVKPTSSTVEINNMSYTCSITDNNIACTISNPSNDRTTDLIQLKLIAPSTGLILISEITVTGECDCNGYKKGTCTRPKNYQTYTCDCTGTRGGQRCQECAAGYSDSSNCTQCNSNMGGSSCDECNTIYFVNFTECFPCDCEINSTDRCDNASGECICKTGVEGTRCTTCKDEYYGFNQNSNEVCKSCNCSQVGSYSSICSPSGQCNCRDGNITRQCTPNGTFSPEYGPVAGGTTITIEGENFAMNPTVKFGGITQNLSSSNIRNRIQFNSPPGSIGDIPYVTVSWNGEEITLNTPYTFKPNPSIDAAQINTNIKILRGCKMMYKGSNFDSVYQPQLEFQTNNYSQKCSIISNEQIECIIPQLKGTMDTYLNLDCPNCGVHQTVNIEIPKVKNDTNEDFTYPFNKRITIKGENLNLCGEDIRVSIEGRNCTNIVIKETEISCEPPKDSPRPLEVQKVYKIMVQIGKYYSLNAGKITYRDFIHSSYFVYIMIGIVAFVLIAIVLFILCICRRKKHRNKDMQMSISDPAALSTVPNNYTEMQKTNIDIIRPPSTVSSGIQNSAYTSEEDFEKTKKNFLQKLPHGLKSDVASCIIFENEFSFGKICYAKGDKARVIDGKLTKGSTTTQIMIKSIKKPFLDNEDYPDWVFKALTECVRFRNLSHTNILSIHGIGLEKRKFHILYPFMKNKTLKDFVSDEKKEFSLKQLLGYGVQISEGMCYLYDQNIVHNDIATRNCMVSHDSLIKISDSAYSHDFYPTEYMLDLTKNRYLPVRWMAPESIKFGFYDVKSDVWSYGVLLWELLTRGCLPFIDTADTGIYDLIEQGYRLGKPEIISDEIYDLINKCWEEESEFRPSFTIIRDTLSNLMVGDSAGQDDLYINWTEPRQSIYMNSESFKRKSEKNQSEPYYGNL